MAITSLLRKEQRAPHSFNLEALEKFESEDYRKEILDDLISWSSKLVQVELDTIRAIKEEREPGEPITIKPPGEEDDVDLILKENSGIESGAIVDTDLEEDEDFKESEDTPNPNPELRMVNATLRSGRRSRTSRKLLEALRSNNFQLNMF